MPASDFKNLPSSFHAKEFNRLLINYFSESEISDFFEKLNAEFEALQKTSLQLTDTPVVSGFISDKIRLITDRLITLAEKKLDRNNFFWFILELARLLTTEGENDIAEEIFFQLLEVTDNNSELVSLNAYSLLGLADVQCRQARWKESQANIKKAKLTFEKLSDSDGLGRCEYYIGTILLEKGDTDAAKIRFENSLSYIDKNSSSLFSGMIEVNLGIISYLEGDLEESNEYYDKGLKIFHELDDRRRIAEVKHNIAMIHVKNRNFEKAVDAYKEIIRLASEGRFLPVLGLAYLSLAQAYTEMKDLEAASLNANKAMEISYRLNDKLTIADVYKIKGVINRIRREYSLSEEFLLTSRRLNRELKNELNFAETSYELGLLYNESTDNDKAKPYFMDALDYYKKIKSPQEISKITGYLN